MPVYCCVAKIICLYPDVAWESCTDCSIGPTFLKMILHVHFLVLSEQKSCTQFQDYFQKVESKTTPCKGPAWVDQQKVQTLTSSQKGPWFEVP